jgi:phosphatidylserine/phosphatidylglycerophosphate/cardiolipin synthase-like enzyme
MVPGNDRRPTWLGSVGQFNQQRKHLLPTMSDFEIRKTKKGFTMKLWRGERMCLLGFDVASPEPDFVGFAIECKEPGASKFEPLKNRLAFDYDVPATVAVTGDRQFPSLEAPFQKFRWIHFPQEVKDGIYTYRATKLHMPALQQLKKGVSLTLKISLDPVTYHGFVDVGFTRNFASSQAFRNKLGNPSDQDMDVIGTKIIPAKADDGLAFSKLKTPADLYPWMGFEAYDLVFGLLDEAVADPAITLDVFAYDFNEPDMLAKLEALGTRLRIIIDDSTSSKKVKGLTVTNGHGAVDSAESDAAKRLKLSTGATQVKRTHFNGLQHHKVLIARRGGLAYKVITGSTNFSFRGLYIQANNALLFDDPEVAGLYGRVFDAAFQNPVGFGASELASKWHLVKKPGKPAVHFCFSPHADTGLSLLPLKGAIAQATSSVFYAVAFLYQMGKGLTKDEFDQLMKRPIFSYGISDKLGQLALLKPDGSTGLVDFEYLAENAPEPFKSEWSGGGGINIHHKFVVTDFNLPTAKVFTGSSNLSPSGEAGNGDHLIMIEDRRIATSFAIEALRVFDHLHFRTTMKDAKKKKPADPSKKLVLKLQKPKALVPAAMNWFESAYVPGSQKEKDRLLFSAPEVL